MIFPSSNLPLDSQPWGREVTKQLSALIDTVAANDINNTARDNQLNSSIIAASAAATRAENAVQGLIDLGQSGSGYTINADNITAGTITGLTLQTAATGARIVIDGATSTISFYDDLDTTVGYIRVTGIDRQGVLEINGPSIAESLILSAGLSELVGGGTSLQVNNEGAQCFGAFVSTGGTNAAGWQSIERSKMASGFISSANSGAAAAGFSRMTSNGPVVNFYRGSTTVVGSIDVTTTATSYVTSSDYRLKENIVPINDGLQRLMELKPSKFNFIIDPDKIVDGFIAHEVQTIVPEAISGTKDAVNENGEPVYQGIDQSKLVPLLVAAVQELTNKVTELEGRING